MEDGLSGRRVQGEPILFERICIHCNNSIRAGSIRCRVCGSQDPFGAKLARRRSALFNNLMMLIVFSMLYFVFYEILPIINVYINIRR